MENILDSLKFVLSCNEFVELKPDQGFQIDLRYATTNNFVGENMYGPFNRAFLHKDAAKQLFEAHRLLQVRNPGYTFIIYDALRPRSIQWILWNHVEGTDAEMYVAQPERGSLHNFGMAVDLSVLDDKGELLDMGAGFDDFRPIAQPILEDKFLAEGILSEKHIKNRLILRNCMLDAGFIGLKHEWWHFDAMDRTVVRESFTIVE
jgi:zinc D-Ala-D-Ala dipeptidase